MVIEVLEKRQQDNTSHGIHTEFQYFKFRQGLGMKLMDGPILWQGEVDRICLADAGPICLISLSIRIEKAESEDRC